MPWPSSCDDSQQSSSTPVLSLIGYLREACRLDSPESLSELLDMLPDAIISWLYVPVDTTDAWICSKIWRIWSFSRDASGGIYIADGNVVYGRTELRIRVDPLEEEFVASHPPWADYQIIYIGGQDALCHLMP